MKNLLVLCSFFAALAVPLHVQAQNDATASAVEKVSVRAVARHDFDSTALREADRSSLLAEVAQLKDVTWQRVTTTGHTDSLGSAEYNRALSQRRAQSVRQFLLSQGLEAAMVQAAGQGEDAPVADNAGPEGRAQNRRTEVRFEGVRRAAR